MKIVPPANMTRLGTIDQWYQSYNIEMLEVTGGMFWKPYGSASSGQTGGAPDRSGVPAGMDANLYEYRRRSIFRTASFAGSRQHWDRRTSE